MYQGNGKVISSVGGLFRVRISPSPDGAPLDGQTVPARGRGILRRRGELLVGDSVTVSYDDASMIPDGHGGSIPAPDGTPVMIEEILPRRNELIRPPMANLDRLYVTVAAATPDPVTETVDKLLCIAEFNRVEPVIVITKTDVDSAAADRLADLYRTAGFPVFLTNTATGDGIAELSASVKALPAGTTAAFSGASGVGKSTLLNRIFPDLHLETGEISQRIERGKNTTRSVSLYPLSASPDSPLLADTPGFTMLDFDRFDFFTLDDLASTFREFTPYIGTCQFKKCTHTKEQGCAILAAVRTDRIPPSRHATYVSLFEVLKKKKGRRP